MSSNTKQIIIISVVLSIVGVIFGLFSIFTERQFGFNLGGSWLFVVAGLAVAKNKYLLNKNDEPKQAVASLALLFGLGLLITLSLFLAEELLSLDFDYWVYIVAGLIVGAAIVLINTLRNSSNKSQSSD